MPSQDLLPALADLDDWQLVDEDQDIRGCPVLNANDQELGVIRRMLVDRDHERVAAVVLDNGRTIPVEQIDILDNKVVMTGKADPAARAGNAGDVDERRIPIVEEDLAVGKRTVERGQIRVRSRVVQMPVEAQISLREEHVDISRRTVDQPVRDADTAFRDRTVEMNARSEEAIVSKQARVVEEVVVRKDADERVETIKDSVRRTEVDIQNAPASR